MTLNRRIRSPLISFAGFTRFSGQAPSVLDGAPDRSRFAFFEFSSQRYLIHSGYIANQDACTLYIIRTTPTEGHSMNRFVQCTPRFDRCLKDLDKGGGKAARAAERARNLFEELIAEGERNPFKAGRLTGHGESRLHHSVKYDLGNGYRLVCLLRGNVCTLAYAGSHDECNRWIRGQHSRIAHREPHRTTSVAERRISPSASEEQDLRVEADDYEASLAEKLQDTDIIRVFNGLCKRG